jgi:hypothetical protein
MSNSDTPEQIDLLNQVLDTDTRIKELNLAREYLNSDYYWKRYNELVELKKFLLRENVRRFNSNQTT